jgi:hypothetical protein
VFLVRYEQTTHTKAKLSLQQAVEAHRYVSWEVRTSSTYTRVKLYLKQAVEDHRVVRRRISHIFYTIGSQIAVRLSALRTGLALSPGKFLGNTWITQKGIQCITDYIRNSNCISNTFLQYGKYLIK